VAVIDPGPDVSDHIGALVLAVGDADRADIVLTHGHADHAGAARALASALDCRVLGPAGLPDVDDVLVDGDIVETDDGSLVAIHTPGHSQEHLCFHWESRGALFAGDHLLGKGDTTWVAEYPGCVADYLDSLARLRTLGLQIIYPAHGPPLNDPAEALDRFEDHRRERIRQVEEALAEDPTAGVGELLQVVYGGSLPGRMGGPAGRSLAALLEYVREQGQG
jgi:glyoxylase-like metal-dependent hydrolase (beta-lactamase superfamily II)